MPKDMYKKLLTDNVTVNYKKTYQPIKHQINREAKKIAENYDIEKRVDRFAENESFITIKDHKEHFPNTIKCRLLNQLNRK